MGAIKLRRTIPHIMIIICCAILFLISPLFASHGHHVPVLGAPARASRCCRDAWRERKARLSRLGSIPAAAEGSIQHLVQGTHTLLYSLCRISRPCYGAARGGFLSARRVLRTSEPAPADGATWTPWQGAEQSARPGTADGPSAVFGLPDPCAAQASTSPP